LSKTAPLTSCRWTPTKPLVYECVNVKAAVCFFQNVPKCVGMRQLPTLLLRYICRGGVDAVQEKSLSESSVSKKPC